MSHKLDHIIEEHLPKIYKTCLGFAGDHIIAKDLVQESCINICLGFENFKGRSTIATWIYRVTVNTCLMYKRGQKDSAVPLSDIGEVDFLHDSTSQREESKLLIVSKLLTELPEQDRIIIILYLERLSQKEISEIIGISPNYVGVRISRIKNKLFKKFKKIWET